MKSNLSKFDRIGTPVLACLAIGFFVMETLFQLRQRKENRWERLRTNAGIATIGLAGLRGALLPAMVNGAEWSQKNKVGLLHRFSTNVLIKSILAFILLDYTNYLWHTVNHKSSFLWRFHNVHHTDLDLDISTAWRFHIVEVLLSVIFRGGMVVLIGAAAPLLLVYEVFYEAATAFHHSNWQLPFSLERRLNQVVVTPRMHGIHHSIVLRETNSNYSIIFSFWDRLHGTVRLNVPQEKIVIGVPSYINPSEQKTSHLLMLPFTPLRGWALPDGTKPDRIYTGKTDELLP